MHVLLHLNACEMVLIQIRETEISLEFRNQIGVSLSYFFIHFQGGIF